MSEAMELDEALARHHAVLADFLDLTVRMRDGWIRRNGGGIRCVSRWFPWR